MKAKIIKAIAFALIVSSFSILSVGCSDDEKEETTSTVTENAEIVTTDKKESSETSDVPDSDNTESSGGNPNQSDSISVQITVSGNEYIYDNKTISFDEISKEIEIFGENYIVEIYDDSASEKAYQSLIDKLTELNISYTEATE